jgi:hypothetical protein
MNNFRCSGTIRQSGGTKIYANTLQRRVGSTLQRQTQHFAAAVGLFSAAVCCMLRYFCSTHRPDTAAILQCSGSWVQSCSSDVWVCGPLSRYFRCNPLLNKFGSHHCHSQPTSAFSFNSSVNISNAPAHLNTIQHSNSMLRTLNTALPRLCSSGK